MCVVLLGVAPSNATAMCIKRLEAGFPHAQVRSYPANLRGVLFQAPLQDALSVQHFTVSSPDDHRRLQIRFEQVVLPLDSAAARNLPHQVQLVRIMIEGGYRAGSTYSIAYAAPRDTATQYPAAIMFKVDTAPVDMSSSDVSFSLQRAAVRSHVLMTEDTGIGMIAATRVLETRVAGALQRYAGAVSFFPEWATVDGKGTAPTFEPLRQTASACSGETFGSGAPDRTDVVYQACHQLQARKVMRASAGFLELGDRMLVLPVASLDWDADIRAACAGYLQQPPSKQEWREAEANGGMLPPQPVKR